MEPGLIRVFRWYAWLRLISLTLLPLIAFHARGQQVSSGPLPVALVVLDVLVLLVYLYIPGLERRLGRVYFPVGILIATFTLLIEQYFLINNVIGWQQFPFMFVLLILISWQYRFSAVVIYSLGIAALEFILLILVPIRFETISLLTQEIQQLVAFGLLFSRTIIFLVIGYVVTALMKAQREQQRALAEANQKLIQHAETLEQLTISRERNRLSRELHDTLAHTLSALVVQLEALLTVWEPVPERAQQMLSNMLTTTRVGLDETRRALSALRATPLEELGLALAVRTLAEDFGTRHALEMDIDIPEDLDDIPPDVEQSFYRISQEALANIAQHARASSVAIRLDRVNHGLELLISDDGTGFSLDGGKRENQRKFGIQGMYERADAIGADLEIIKQPRNGTLITLFWGSQQ